jgi:hypothetical protein
MRVVSIAFKRVEKIGLASMYQGSSSAVKHSTHDPEIKGLNPTIGTGREKMVKT